MKKKILILAFITVSYLNSYSQIIFEKGYFIDESNQKIECLIKNIDWLNNPTQFEYKLSINDEVQKATIKNIKEFGVNDLSKYVRAKTNIDRSTNVIDKMKSKRNPDFKEEVLFLKVLIEGKESLFKYVDGNLTRFFYTLENSKIEQLVFKNYVVDGTIFENNYFKQQLFQKLKCEEIGLKNIKRLKYSEQYLKKLFVKYNQCVGTTYNNFEKKQKKDLFNLTLRPGLLFNSLKIENPDSNSRDTDFGSNSGFRLGLETEFILPFNKNKWAILIEPTYQYYNTEQIREVSSIPNVAKSVAVDYTSIEIPIGLRHYFFINNTSKLFTNISYVLDFSINSDVTFLREDRSEFSVLNIKSMRNLALGIGYKYKNRYSLEIRYNAKREILNDYVRWKSNYSGINMILGFSFF